jgi:hypothetical protein
MGIGCLRRGFQASGEGGRCPEDEVFAPLVEWGIGLFKKEENFPKFLFIASDV